MRKLISFSAVVILAATVSLVADQTQKTHKAASTSASADLVNQPQLVAKLQPLLPTGTDVKAEAAGFKKLDTFVTAVHVSHNLSIPFKDLKAKVAGAEPESLGVAIHDLKPHADEKAELKKARAEADTDLGIKTPKGKK